VTPPPTATVTDTAPTCPPSYTCGFILSRATCTSATVCSTPSSGGPYTPLQTAATALPTPSFVDTPPTGVYVSYTYQFVFLTGPGLTAPEIAPPSPNSTAQLIAFYPATMGAPGVTTTAALAPSLLPDAPTPQIVASNDVPRMAQPTVQFKWR
jgi:hypothetical protein